MKVKKEKKETRTVNRLLFFHLTSGQTINFSSILVCRKLNESGAAHILYCVFVTSRSTKQSTLHLSYHTEIDKLIEIVFYYFFKPHSLTALNAIYPLSMYVPHAQWNTFFKYIHKVLY